MIGRSSTTIRVLRSATSDLPQDPWDEQDGAERTIAHGVRAQFSRPSGKPDRDGGNSSTVDWEVLADPIAGVLDDDVVVDESTGERFRVAWSAQRSGARGHTKLGVLFVSP